ncbi:hypothetical protein [Aliikangiella sp. IMCC44632]
MQPKQLNQAILLKLQQYHPNPMALTLIKSANWPRLLVFSAFRLAYNGLKTDFNVGDTRRDTAIIKWTIMQIKDG